MQTEKALKPNPLATTLKNRIKLVQHQINTLLLEEVAKKIKFAKHFF